MNAIKGSILQQWVNIYIEINIVVFYDHLSIQVIKPIYFAIQNILNEYTFIGSTSEFNSLGVQKSNIVQTILSSKIRQVGLSFLQNFLIRIFVLRLGYSIQHKFQFSLQKLNISSVSILIFQNSQSSINMIKYHFIISNLCAIKFAHIIIY